MNPDSFVAECVARKGLNPALTAKQVVTAVMADVASVKAEMSTRAEFCLPEDHPEELAAVAAEVAQDKLDLKQ